MASKGESRCTESHRQISKYNNFTYDGRENVKSVTSSVPAISGQSGVLKYAYDKR